MKIDGLSAQNIYESYQKTYEHAGSAKQAEPTEKVGDVVELSPRAADLQEAGRFARQSVGESADGRAARVARIKVQVADGTYQVPSEELARTLLKGVLFDRRV